MRATGSGGRAGAAMAVLALLAACSPSPPPKAAAPAPPPSEVVVIPNLPAYVCPNGRLVELEEDKETGKVRLADGSTELLAFRAADSKRTRFVNGELTISFTPDQLVIEGGRTRRLVCPRRPAAPVAGVLWGRLEKRDRMALASGTTARVVIADVSRADAPAEELASTTIVTDGNQVPLHFLIRYDPSRVREGMTYALMARIEAPGGELLYITDTHNALFTDGQAQPPLDLMLVPARP